MNHSESFSEKSERPDVSYRKSASNLLSLLDTILEQLVQRTAKRLFKCDKGCSCCLFIDPICIAANSSQIKPDKPKQKIIAEPQTSYV